MDIAAGVKVGQEATPTFSVCHWRKGVVANMVWGSFCCRMEQFCGSKIRVQVLGWWTLRASGPSQSWAKQQSLRPSDAVADEET